MGTAWCPVGEHEVTVAFRPARGELWCDEHECKLGERRSLKAGSGFRADRESPLRRAARQRFNRLVKQHGCFYSAYRSRTGRSRRAGHVCVYPLDAHHIVEKQWIESNYGDLDEADLLVILFSPAIGAPLCRGGHGAVKTLQIFWDELEEECIEFCRSVDDRWLDVPTPSGVRRESMYARLRLECPLREVAA